MNPEFLGTDRDATPPIVTVAELNRLAGRLLERHFALLWVAGEISNLTRAASGHWYFLLKDRDAQVRCVMFRGRNSLLDWAPENGARVEARATVGLYAARGDFQLTVEHLRRAGVGALYEAFLRLKQKLEVEGLFDAARKRPLPRHARAIGVVTSPQAAALRDVLATLRRRAPHVRVIIYPAPVQGADAPARLVEALERAARRAVTLGEIDVLLLVRGGGSIEDLAAFNDEALARAIAAFPLPLVTGIGHETDFTIADFVAHLRAPTPTAAAELAAPDGAALGQELRLQQRRLDAAWERLAARAAQRLDDAQRRLRSPAQQLAEAERRLAALAERLGAAQAFGVARLAHRVALARARLAQHRPAVAPRQMRLAWLAEQLAGRARQRLLRADNALERAATRLALLDPRGLLARGYAIVSDAAGRVVSDVAVLAPGARIDIALARGTAVAQVIDLAAPKT